MKLLSFEASSVSASVSVTDGTKLIAQSFQNCGLTHSKTLMPMAEALLKSIDMKLSDVDGIAVSAGPGSFTGVRIGVSVVKGLCQGADKPCIGVSSLEAMARAFGPTDKIICAVMDARAGQVYNALFCYKDGIFTRLCDDRAIKLSELDAELTKKAYVLVGDGANLCYNNLTAEYGSIASGNLVYPTAYGVALAALERKDNFVSADLLEPFYLRLPQAERERLAKSNK